jgi:hypothetical protein
MDGIKRKTAYNTGLAGGGTASFGLNGTIYTGNYNNNINFNPVFTSPTTGAGVGFNSLLSDWSLQSNSPCINTGDSIGNYITTDIINNNRVSGIIDIGAYEFQLNVNINTIPFKSELVIFPNPFQNTTTIEFNYIENDWQLIITDISGRQVTSKNIYSSKFQIHRNDLQSGVYFVNILKNGYQICSKKIIISE